MQEPRHKPVKAGCFVLRHGADDRKYLLLGETLVQARELHHRELQGVHVNYLGLGRSKVENGREKFPGILVLFFLYIFQLFLYYLRNMINGMKTG
jgi:hypothetical protein